MTDKNHPTDIVGLRALLAKATKRPWRCFTSPYGNEIMAIMKGDRPITERWKQIITWSGFDGTDVGKRYDRANQELIVAAINALPGLLDEIEAPPNTTYLRQRIEELMDDGAGFWRNCSGCQEAPEGCLSTTDYPYSDVFKCNPGSGCSECGGIGVIWDDIDYDAMAREMLAEPQHCDFCGAPPSIATVNCQPPFHAQPHQWTGLHPADQNRAAG